MMLSSSDRLEQYRSARNKLKPIDDQHEALYHKRQRIILENSRTNAYKQKLTESKRRERPVYRRNNDYHSPLRLPNSIRYLFQIDQKQQSKTSTMMCSSTDNKPMPRLYPSVLNLRSVTSKESMNMNILQQIEFLGQYDNKFLICKNVIRSSYTHRIQVIVFDQHAISERILLERLQNYFKNEKISKMPFKLCEPIIIARNPRFLYTPDQINSLECAGFVLSAISIHHLLIRAVPNWLLSLGQRQSSKSSLLTDIIQCAIDNVLTKTDNNSKNLELTINETLKSLACHNAIKFNDVLSHDECHHLLNELKLCAMPFICAHGRNSVATLWEYDIISEKYQINTTELQQLASIHKWLKES